MRVCQLQPNQCDPPHGVSHHDFVIDLANEFVRNGWGRYKPMLVGYPWKGKIQLLSGSHRWAAATLAELSSIPVIVWDTADVEEAWGDPDKWSRIMRSGGTDDGRNTASTGNH